MGSLGEGVYNDGRIVGCHDSICYLVSHNILSAAAAAEELEMPEEQLLEIVSEGVIEESVGTYEERMESLSENFSELTNDRSFQENFRVMCTLGQEIYDDGRECGRRQVMLRFAWKNLIANADAAAGLGISEAEFAECLEGYKEGFKEGLLKGRAEGFNEGYEAGGINMLSELVSKGLLSRKEAAEHAQLSEWDFLAKVSCFAHDDRRSAWHQQSRGFQ